MAYFGISLLNGLSSGLLLFMLSAGLTLIFGMMGVLNFAHASFYMLGAYLAFTVARAWGFWAGLVFAPLLVGLTGALFERYCLRRLHAQGPLAGLLATFGLAYVLLELVQLVWGRSAVPYRIPPSLDGALFSLAGAHFPIYRAFIMGVALLVLIALALALRATRAGLLVQAALTHPRMLGALGHDVPLLRTLVFATGAALAGLAGVLGGNAFVTEPGMAAALGPVVFVVVVAGGMGSLSGAFLVSLAIGLLQSFAVGAGGVLGQSAPVLPYLLLVAMLALRPDGLRGRSP